MQRFTSNPSLPYMGKGTEPILAVDYYLKLSEHSGINTLLFHNNYNHY